MRLENVCSFRQLKEQNVRLQEQLEKRFSFGKIVGKSKRMEEVFELIRLVAGSDADVLVQGESGTGKELVASAIHDNSARAGEPFIARQLRRAPRVADRERALRLREGRLHRAPPSGAWGASRRRDGGTLFLDEIGEHAGLASR